VEAVGALLAREGFFGIGVNAVAREAGVDKVLIYRYFGGLPGLMAAYGREGDFWPTVEEMAGGDVEAVRRMDPVGMTALLLKNFMTGLRRRPVTLEILAWEVQERNELTVELEKVREAVGLALIETFYPAWAGGAEPGRDLAGLVALTAAGIMYLVMRAHRGVEVFNTVDLADDEGWRRLEDAIDAMARGFFRALES
jgi:AcrR family transcriptional regulator